MAKLEMMRGRLQALFRYLPNAWVDYKSSKEIVAVVTEWDSRPLNNVNVKRVFKNVERAVSTFRKLKNMYDRISEEDYELMEPRNINVKVSPLTFFCSKCYKAYRFKDAEIARKATKNYRCLCGGVLKQFDLIFACECGWAEAVTVRECKEHGLHNMYYKYNDDIVQRGWTCKICREFYPMKTKCPECKSFLMPSPFRQFDVYIPKTLTMVDLVEREKEKMLEDPRLQKLIYAEYLGYVTFEEIKDCVAKANTEETRSFEDRLAEKVQELIAAGLDQGMAEMVARNLLKNSDPQEKMNRVIEKVENHLYGSSEMLYDRATSLLEYLSVKKNSKLEIKEAAQFAKQLSSSAEPQEFQSVLKKYGIADAQACSGVSMIFCSYGYTRRNIEPETAVLRGFPPDREQKGTGKKPIYATKLETEGILLEFDRRKIVEWLLKNKLIDEQADNVPQDLNDDDQLKLWFLSHVKSEVIGRYREINEEEHVTKHVYTLLHSISHVLMKKAADLCGLGIDSLSEYIFPNVPALFIYCHNAQGFKLGAMFNLFQAFLDKWILESVEYAKDCLYDPICIEGKAACLGCLHINEISCQHMNKDLNRAYLVGRIEEDSQIHGFWELI